MKEEIKLDVSITPEQAHVEAAKSFYNRLLSDSRQIENMRHYCREMARKLPCDLPLPTHDPSKDIKIRYGLNYGENNIVWSILEDYFKIRMKESENGK